LLFAEAIVVRMAVRLDLCGKLGVAQRLRRGSRDKIMGFRPAGGRQGDAEHHRKRDDEVQACSEPPGSHA
jgi:hypothetical protein